MNALVDVGQMANVCHSSSSVICTTSIALLSPGLQKEFYESADIFGVRLHAYYQAYFLY